MKKRFFSFLRKTKYRYTKGIAKGWRVSCDSTSMEEFASLGDFSAIRNSSIGRYSSIGRNATIHNAKIGAFCSISWNVTIGATSHPVSHPSTHAFPYVSRYQFVKDDHRIVQGTVVGSDVWIGANAIILPGVTIGNGAVIGAGSVVTKDVPSYFIVAGVPAKQIGERFDREVASLLESISWWDWDEDRIKTNMDFFGSPLTSETMSQVK